MVATEHRQPADHDAGSDTGLSDEARDAVIGVRWLIQVLQRPEVFLSVAGGDQQEDHGPRTASQTGHRRQL